jgi:hypothetical protein
LNYSIFKGWHDTSKFRKNKMYRTDSNFGPIYFVPGDSLAGIRPCSLSIGFMVKSMVFVNIFTDIWAKYVGYTKITY